MIRHWIGQIGLAYALNTPTHRGKFRMLWFLDRIFGPFQLENKKEKICMNVYLSSSMDVSYFRRHGLSDPLAMTRIDECMPRLIKDLRPGDVFIDVGANIGFLSIMASKRVGPTGLVVAIEPSAREYARLLTNLALNQATNVLPIHAALGECAGIADLEVAPHHTGLNRLKNQAEAIGDCIRVPVFRGTDLLRSLLQSERPVLVKIDVEGAEVLVLRGLEDFLRKCLPAKLVVEVTPRFLADFGSSRDELYECMSGIGYEAMLNLDTDQYDEVFRPTKSGG